MIICAKKKMEVNLNYLLLVLVIFNFIYMLDTLVVIVVDIRNGNKQWLKH